MKDLIAGVSDFVQHTEKQHILFTGNVKANNERLDIYREKMKQQTAYMNILKDFVYGMPNNDGEIKTKLQLSKEQKGQSLLAISKEQYNRIACCSSWFQYESDVSWNRHRVKQANRCMHKYCPHCARNLAFKRTLQADSYMQNLYEKGYEFLFLTLTLKNVQEDELKATLTKMNTAVNQKLLKYVDIKQVAFTTQDLKQLANAEIIKAEDKGMVITKAKAKELAMKNNAVSSIRKFELTYNPYVYKNGKVMKQNNKKIKNKDKAPFHPHLHLILAVDPKKYAGKKYIKHERLQEMWKQALAIDYLPHVNIQKVAYEVLEEREEKLEIKHSEVIDDTTKKKHVAFEIGKYIAKSSEYLENADIFEMFFKNLFKRRAWTFTGQFKALHKEWKNVRLDDESDDTEYVYQTDYNYSNGDYYMSKVQKILGDDLK